MGKAIRSQTAASCVAIELGRMAIIQAIFKIWFGASSIAHDGAKIHGMGRLNL